MLVGMRADAQQRWGGCVAEEGCGADPVFPSGSSSSFCRDKMLSLLAGRCQALPGWIWLSRLSEEPRTRGGCGLSRRVQPEREEGLGTLPR